MLLTASGDSRAVIINKAAVIQPVEDHTPTRADEQVCTYWFIVLLCNLAHDGHASLQMLGDMKRLPCMHALM
jgi:hypothetical protein